MNASQTLKEKYNANYNAGLLKRWGTLIEGVKKVYPQYDQISSINLAIVCENTQTELNKYLRRMNVTMNEITQTGTLAVPGDVGPYVRHAFEIIAGVMPNLCAEEVVSVQALNQKIGQIFFMQYVYGSNKGTVKKGETAFGPYDIASNPNYSSEHVDQEILVADITEANITTSLQWGPVAPGTVKLAAGTAHAEDDGEGNITGDFTGTIDYDTQALMLNGLPLGETLESEYDYNLSYAPAEAAEFDMHISEKIVVARPRKLRARYSFDAAYDVEKQFGIDMDRAMLEASIAEIKHEIDQELFADLYRQAALTNTWNAIPPAGVPEQQHNETFNKKVIEMSNQIFKATKRVHGNRLVCGINATTLVESLLTFVPAGGAEDEAGAHVIGSLKSRIKVLTNPWYGDDEFLLAYKGDNFLEAGYVYAPYLPVFATNVIMLDDFMGRRGFGTSYAKIMLCPTYFVKGTITYNKPVLPVEVVGE